MSFAKKSALSIVILGVLATLLYTLIYIKNEHHGFLTLYGNVDIRNVNLSFRTFGRLKTLAVDEGDPVFAGELLASLDPEPYIRELRAAQANVLQQKALLTYRETVYQREKKLFGTGASSTDRYNEALSSRDATKAALQKSLADFSVSLLHLQDTKLYSPASGVVLTRVTEPGTILTSNDTVLSINLIDPVWIRAYIDEKFLGLAKPGMKVRVYSDSFPKKTFEGSIGFVSPIAEFTPKSVETPDLRTNLVYRLRITMQDPLHELRQGMPVTIKIKI